MKKCYLCDGDVMWKSDYEYNEFGLEKDGIVHIYQCQNCGCRIEVYEDLETGDLNDTST